MPKVTKNRTVTEALHHRLHYDPETGVFTTAKTARSKKHGRIVGWRDELGYIRIWVNRKLYLAHRLAWLWVHGKFPDGNLDHINGNPSDNRIANLRECNQSQNCANSIIQRKGSSTRKGVSFDKAKKSFRAYITVGRKQIFLGRFLTAKEAIAVRKAAEPKYHGEFMRKA